MAPICGLHSAFSAYATPPASFFLALNAVKSNSAYILAQSAGKKKEKLSEMKTGMLPDHTLELTCLESHQHTRLIGLNNESLACTDCALSLIEKYSQQGSGLSTKYRFRTSKQYSKDNGRHKFS